MPDTRCWSSAAPVWDRGIPDELYREQRRGWSMRPTISSTRPDMVIKVKEPQPQRVALLRAGPDRVHVFPFRGRRKLTESVLATGITAVAYETLRDKHGRLPLLTPMSEVAGRMSIQEGAKYPRASAGRTRHSARRRAGRRCRRTSRFSAAAWWAQTPPKSPPVSGPTSTLLDVNVDRLRYLDDIMPANVNTLYSDRHTIREQLQRADLVIGAVLIPGAQAPELIEREDLKLMKPGSRDHRRGDRPRGLRGNDRRPTTHSEPDVHRRRGRALLRDQHAGRGRPHEHLRAVQRDTALGVSVRQPAGRNLASGLTAAIARAVNIMDDAVTNRAVAETFGHAVNPGTRGERLGTRKRTECHAESQDRVERCDFELGRRG